MQAKLHNFQIFSGWITRGPEQNEIQQFERLMSGSLRQERTYVAPARRHIPFGALCRRVYHRASLSSGCAIPVYPIDDFSLPAGSPGIGFVVFDPTQAGRNNPVINPPAIPATFVTTTFDPTTSVAEY